MPRSKMYGLAVTLFLALLQAQGEGGGWQISTIFNAPLVVIQMN